MSEAEVIRAMRAHLEGLFPKVCNNCQRKYGTLHEYLRHTRHLGPAIPYDAEVGDWNPLKPLGTLTYALCPCGTTLALSSEGLPLFQLWRLLNWARTETKRRGLTPTELLGYLREEICKEVLQGPPPLVHHQGAEGRRDSAG